MRVGLATKVQTTCVCKSFCTFTCGFCRIKNSIHL